MITLVERFLNDDSLTVGPVESERALQLELGLFLRQNGYKVQFEKTCRVQPHERQTKRQKRYLDLLIGEAPDALAIELKVPLAGRVPETKYDFIADVAFVEAVIDAGIAKSGLSLMLTHDRAFWHGRAEGIYAPFRTDGRLEGLYQKPTGQNSSQVYLANSYKLNWKPLKNTGLMSGAKYVVAMN